LLFLTGFPPKEKADMMFSQVAGTFYLLCTAQVGTLLSWSTWAGEHQWVQPVSAISVKVFTLF